MSPLRAGLLALLLPVAGGAVVGCSGMGVEEPAEEAQAVEVVDPAVLSKTWVIAVASDEIRAPFEANKGWIRLVSHRDVRVASSMLARDGGLSAARAHAEAASLFRQAALLVAHSFIQTYGHTGQPTDPAGTAHLLMVSHILAGDLDAARREAGKMSKVPPELAAWHRPWASWLEAGGQWPPDLSDLPVDLPVKPTVGSWPMLSDLPHYRLPERGGSEYKVDYADPGALAALALWHEAAAVAAAGPAQADAVLAFGGRYRWPIEPAASAADLPLELAFGSDFLLPGDASFLAAVVGGQADAVTAHADRSLLAHLAERARVKGALSPEVAIDLAAGLRSELLAAQVEASGGDRVFHRPFADLAEVAVLRGLALVAEAEGDRESSGVLRINAKDKSIKGAGCPSFLLSLAAWDAANRYPARGTEIVHNLARRYPSLEAARYGLDALALRVSRERVDQGVGM